MARDKRHPTCSDDFRASHYLWFQAEAQQALVTSQCVIWQYGCKLQCAEKKTCSPPPPGCTNRTRKPCARKCKSTVRKSCERVCRDTVRTSARLADYAPSLCKGPTARSVSDCASTHALQPSIACTAGMLSQLNRRSVLLQTCTQTCSTQAGGFTLPLTTLRMVDVPAGGTCPSAPPLSCQSTCSTDHCTTVLERSGGRTLLGHHPPLGVHCGSVPGTADDAQPLKASRRLLQRERRARQTRPTDAPRPPRRTRASRPMDPPRVRLSREGSAQRSRSGDAAGATSTSLDDDTATPTRVRSTNDDDSNDSDMAALGVYGGSGAVGVYGADEPGTVRGADDLVDGNAQDGAVFDEPDVLAPSTSATQPATAAATADALAPGPATRPLAADGWASAAAAGAPPEGGVLDQSFQGGGAVAIGRAAAPAAAVWDGCNPVRALRCM